jgi:hypothetical protein
MKADRRAPPQIASREEWRAARMALLDGSNRANALAHTRFECGLYHLPCAAGKRTRNHPPARCAYGSPTVTMRSLITRADPDVRIGHPDDLSRSDGLDRARWRLR